MSEVEDNAQTESNTATDSDQDVAKSRAEKADAKRETDTSTPQSDQEKEIEKDDHPAFSLATLGLQRVGTVLPPKPKAVQQPIQMLNARGMPARIRKRNRFFFDENIINDDKPLRMRLSPKKLPLKYSGPSAGASTEQNEDSVGQPRNLRKTKVTPAKVLEKRKGVISRYMRSEPVNSKIRKNASTKLKANVKKTQQGKVVKIKTKPPPSTKRGKGKNLITEASTFDSPKTAASDADGSGDESKLFANKLIGQTIGLSLRNLLKLPKAHKWAIAEWFYSYIDKPLFEGDSDFENYVKDIYPGLQTRNLTRAEWRCVRRTMGKPRRCSQAFLDAERRELSRKRMLLRTLQSRKPGDLKDVVLLRDMPDKIPMSLPVGTKVTARLRHPQDGIFSGSVDAYDSLNGMYRVTFERLGLGTHTISDYEIVSENFHEMLPLHTFIKDFRPNLISIFTGKRNNMQQQKQLVSNIMSVRSTFNIKLNKSDPLLGQEAFSACSPYKTQLTRYHGYPSKLLEYIVRLQRTSNMKHSKVQRQSDMNDEAELLVGNLAPKYPIDDVSMNLPLPITGEFQRRYASNIISIEKLNEDIKYCLNEVQKLSVVISRDPNVLAMVAPTFLREKCREIADKTVERLNSSYNPVKNCKILKLVKNLAMLLIITSRIGGENKVAKVLDGCIEEVQTNLIKRDNSETFQNNVQSNLNQLASIINKNSVLLTTSLLKKSYAAAHKEKKQQIKMSENENKVDGDKAKEAIDKEHQNEKQQVTENEQDQVHENDGIAPIDESKIQEEHDGTTSQNEETKNEIINNADVKSIEQDQVQEKKDESIEKEIHQGKENNDLGSIEQGQAHDAGDTTKAEHRQEGENMSSKEQGQQMDETNEQDQQQVNKTDEQDQQQVNETDEQDQQQVNETDEQDLQQVNETDEQDQQQVNETSEQDQQQVNETNEQFQSQDEDDEMTSIVQVQDLIQETDETTQSEHLEDQGDDGDIILHIEQSQESMTDDIIQNEQYEIHDDDMMVEIIDQGQLYETDDTSQTEQIHVETDDEVIARNEDVQVQDNDIDVLELSQSEQFQLKVDDDVNDDDDDVEMIEEEHLIETDELNSIDEIIEVTESVQM